MAIKGHRLQPRARSLAERLPAWPTDKPLPEAEVMRMVKRVLASWVQRGRMTQQEAEAEWVRIEGERRRGKGGQAA